MGKEVILVAVDKMTKYAHFIALSHPCSATSVVKAYWDNVFKYMASQILLSVAETLPLLVPSGKNSLKCKGLVCICLVLITHKVIGQSEVVNLYVGTYLRCTYGNQPHDWCRWLPLAE